MRSPEFVPSHARFQSVIRSIRRFGSQSGVVLVVRPSSDAAITPSFLRPFWHAQNPVQRQSLIRPSDPVPKVACAHRDKVSAASGVPVMETPNIPLFGVLARFQHLIPPPVWVGSGFAGGFLPIWQVPAQSLIPPTSTTHRSCRGLWLWEAHTIVELRPSQLDTHS